MLSFVYSRWIRLMYDAHKIKRCNHQENVFIMSRLLAPFFSLNSCILIEDIRSMVVVGALHGLDQSSFSVDQGSWWAARPNFSVSKKEISIISHLDVAQRYATLSQKRSIAELKPIVLNDLDRSMASLFSSYKLTNIFISRWIREIFRQWTVTYFDNDIQNQMESTVTEEMEITEDLPDVS